MFGDAGAVDHRHREYISSPFSPMRNRVVFSAIMASRNAQRSPYTKAEDKFILDYISKGMRYDQVKGAAMWRSLSTRMEKNGMLRTWQSARQRFLKQIIPNIKNYKLAKNEEEKLLQPFKGPRGHYEASSHVPELENQDSVEDLEDQVQNLLKRQQLVSGVFPILFIGNQPVKFI